mmetsp:Transcript_1560/g.2384  ORF Transcript_1560/g.2384 Transcript_1560/m.2384 type:complete len:211 (-) Transcript_1560:3653-4285(-)
MEMRRRSSFLVLIQPCLCRIHKGNVLPERLVLVNFILPLPNVFVNVSTHRSQTVDGGAYTRIYACFSSRFCSIAVKNLVHWKKCTRCLLDTVEWPGSLLDVFVSTNSRRKFALVRVTISMQFMCSNSVVLHVPNSKGLQVGDRALSLIIQETWMSSFASENGTFKLVNCLSSSTAILGALRQVWNGLGKSSMVWRPHSLQQEQFQDLCFG